MVINSNITGTTGSPLEKSTARAIPKSNTTNPALNPAQSSAAAVLKSLSSNGAANVSTALGDGDGLDFNIQSAKAMIFSQPANALLAQASLTPETVFSLLQD
jgi:hypothetical protein